MLPVNYTIVRVAIPLCKAPVPKHAAIAKFKGAIPLGSVYNNGKLVYKSPGNRHHTYT